MMIKPSNKPLNKDPFMEDFTTENYRALIRLARDNYNFVFYDNIPFDDKFVLWRHDCDYSLNRAAKLAKLESEEGVCSTYFINLHCEFYNPLEESQTRLIRLILNLGHQLGVHFDAAFYNITLESDLNEQLSYEAQLLEHFFGIQPKAFSFHNPSEFLLTCDAKEYGGLFNCYSKKLKEEIPYVSDSNGYWRFRRLRDVLTKADDACLQVLTHPAWWQNKAVLPWWRIKRCVEGRAESKLRDYERDLKKSKRLNLGKG